MAEIIYMPKLSDTMTEGVVAEWHKKIGDTVLFGMLKEESENGDLSLNLITFHEEELGELYEEDEEFYKVTKISKIPNIKRKEDGGN